MEGFRKGASVPASQADRRRAQAWSEAVAEDVLRRVAAGETLVKIGEDPTMPAKRTIVGWITKRSGFRAAMEAARSAAGRSFVGRPSSYCQATAEAIYERLCAGEAMVTICRDPEMPVASTVYKWMKEQDDFRRVVGLSREIQADALGAEGWDMAMAAEHAEARLTEMRLRHLRWYAGKLSPRVYGPARAVEPWAAAGEAGPPPLPKPEPVTQGVTLKSFWTETGPDGQVRVRSSWYCPNAGRIEEDVPGDWKLPPGQMAFKAALADRRQASLEAAQARRRAQPPETDPDPEGWR